MLSELEEAPRKAATDVLLIRAARHGDESAQGELFRRHWRPAVRLAARLIGPSDADDLTSEAFAKVFALIAEGKGPSGSFRAYLMATVRTMHVDVIRRSREIPVGLGDDAVFERSAEDDGGAKLAKLDREMVAAAFGTLPERWQKVLWRTAVDGEKLSSVAHEFGMNSNAVAALSFRAREGLRRAFLEQHVSQAPGVNAHRELRELPAYVREALPADKAAAIRDHLDGCETCRVVADDLSTVERNLRTGLGPALAGSAFTFTPDLDHGACADAVAQATDPCGWSSMSAWVKAAAVVGIGALVAGLAHLRDAYEPPAEPALTSSGERTAAPPATDAHLLDPTLGAPPGTLGPHLRWVDASLGTVQGQAVAAPRLRMLFPVSGQLATLYLEITIENADDVAIDHTRGAPWQCESAPNGADEIDLTCVLAVREAPASQNLALVVAAAHDGPVYGHATVHTGIVRDPDPANDTQQFSIGQ